MTLNLGWMAWSSGDDLATQRTFGATSCIDGHCLKYTRGSDRKLLNIEVGVGRMDALLHAVMNPAVSKPVSMATLHSKSEVKRKAC